MPLRWAAQVFDFLHPVGYKGGERFGLVIQIAKNSCTLCPKTELVSSSGICSSLRIIESVCAATTATHNSSLGIVNGLIGDNLLFPKMN